jgi:hypothetical protein
MSMNFKEFVNALFRQSKDKKFMRNFVLLVAGDFLWLESVVAGFLSIFLSVISVCSVVNYFFHYRK